MQKDIYHEAPSLISRDASAAIKGFMMLLIIWGHTEMMTPNYALGERTLLYYWLYSFHVYIFFILPFIYGSKNGQYDNKDEGHLIELSFIRAELKHNIIKIGVPYFWFFCLSALAFILSGKGEFNPIGVLYAFVFGNEQLMDKYIGFYFMWFLPAMLSLLTIKSVWYHSSMSIRRIIIAISAIIWLLFILNVVTRHQIGMYVPFALSQAFCYIIYGLSCRWIIERQKPKKRLIPTTVLLVLLLTFLLFCSDGLNHNVVNMTATIRLIMPIAIFILLYSSRHILEKSSLLRFIGKYSLQIYLVHVFVINVLFMLSVRFLEPSLILRVAIYVLATAFSSAIAVFLVKTPVFNKLLFPKG